VTDVTIILPIHNAESFIRRTVMSLLKAEPAGIEVICVLDSCTDSTESILIDCFQSCEFESYKIISVSYGSTALSRNRGIVESSGEFVAFLDHDDIVDNALYSRAYKAATTSFCCDVVRSGYSINWQDGSVEVIDKLPSIYAYPFRGIFIWNGIFRRSFLLKNGIKFIPGYGEDYEFNLALLYHRAHQISLTSKNVYYQWNHHGSNLHKKRTAYDYLTRLSSMIKNYGPFLNDSQKINKEFMSWASDYFVHLIKTGHAEGLAEAYFANDLVRYFLKDISVNDVKSLSHYRLLKSPDKSSFIVESKKFTTPIVIAKKAKARFALRSLKSYFHKLSRALSYVRQNGTYKFLDLVYKRYSRFNLSNSFAFLGHRDKADVRVEEFRESKKQSVIFYVFAREFISGGLISIFDIGEKLRNMGYEVLFVAQPSLFTAQQNNLFPNSEVIVPWRRLTKSDWNKCNILMVPEVKVEELVSKLSRNRISCEKIKMNILNQNNDLMPKKSVIRSLIDRFKSVSITTAHEAYSSQTFSDFWEVPLSHISTYMSYDDYFPVPFLEKQDVIILSHDANHFKSSICENLISKCSRYQFVEILGFRYEDYKTIAERAKYSVTFGEGLDNYFIESIFFGGLGFAVFDPVFMTDHFLELDNIFTSFSDMERRLPTLINRLEKDNEYRKTLWEKNYYLLKGMYDSNYYRSKLSSFMCGEFDYYPKN